MKLTIVHRDPSRAGKREVIDREGVVRLGRHPDNDCVFADDRSEGVSGFHAEIRRVDDGVSLVDLASTNGVWLNDRRVKTAGLSLGDTITLGESGPAFQVYWALEESSTTVHPPPPEPKKYGERTVGMLIRQALAQAGLKKRTGTSKSTDYFESLVDEKLRSSSRRLKRFAVLAAIAVVIISGVLVAVYSGRPARVAHPSGIDSGETVGGAIATANRFAIFMLAGIPQTKGQPSADGLEGFCTAFAVGPDLLATNAHCLIEARQSYSAPTVLMNGAPTHRYAVTEMVQHPSYRWGTLSPDVGLLRIRGRLQHVVTLSPPEELVQVAAGVPVFMYGFPGTLNRADAPEATFIKGDIGRVTTFAHRLGAQGQNTLLQHSAFSASGTSGSPLFNLSGRVIGINAGGYLENGKKLTGYNFGMRIDLLDALLRSLPRKEE